MSAPFVEVAVEGVKVLRVGREVPRVGGPAVRDARQLEADRRVDAHWSTTPGDSWFRPALGLSRRVALD
jgi:hypothetical protein